MRLAAKQAPVRAAAPTRAPRTAQVAAVLMAATMALAPSATAAPCGGPFPDFVREMKREALGRSHDPQLVERFFAGAQRDPEVIRADRRQGVFRLDFIEFSRRVISRYRLDLGRRYGRELDALFGRIERDYGVSRGILLALWALETDFGQVQGDFNTRNALLTLAHDCRRPALFRPHLFAALELFRRGDFDPAGTRGAWAGEIGMVQMLPGDVLEHGVDGDGDGHVRLHSSRADALTSAARLLRGFGWRPGEPWLQEVVVPETLDWSLTGTDKTLSVARWKRMGMRARNGALAADGMRASLLLPMGRKGPAFIAYPNFHVLFEWNGSFVYVTTAAYLATRMEGAPRYDPGTPEPMLTPEEMKLLQTRLRRRGHDVGAIDGILGRKTRAAVQKEQRRLGLPPDAWPTRELLERL